MQVLLVDVWVSVSEFRDASVMPFMGSKYGCQVHYRNLLDLLNMAATVDVTEMCRFCNHGTAVVRQNCSLENVMTAVTLYN